MSWRIVVIANKSKLTYKNNYLVVRNENIQSIHLSEIGTLIIDNTCVTLTAYLISELLLRKVKIIFCDAKRNPLGEIIPYYGSHNSSKRIMKQVKWDGDYKMKVWTRIIQEKIKNQGLFLEQFDLQSSQKIFNYMNSTFDGDPNNREGHAARLYFQILFGTQFSREDICDINAALNYGYTIILSQFNKEIVSNGYLTQLGIMHCNEFNQFNLASDLMEPFRPLVDKVVKENYEIVFGSTMKKLLLEILETKVYIKSSNQYVTNAISIYVKSVIKAIEKKDLTLIEFFEYEF